VKNAFIFTLLLAIVVQSFSKVCIWVEFKLNQEYIAKTLCVQKEVEDNCCKGSCHLTKQLEEDDKNQDSQSRDMKNLKEIQLYHENNQSFLLISPLTLEHSFVTQSMSQVVKRALEIFHPPDERV